VEIQVDQDFLDLLSTLNAAEVRYLVVGAYAVGIHGRPRATKDLDVWVDATPENAARVIAALTAFGAPIAGIEATDFAQPGTGFMMGRPPLRIDILTKIAGLTFATAWPRRVTGSFDGIPTPIIGLEDLLANKRAAGRPQDLADVTALERLLQAKRRCP
jgi:hypothetical protein